MADTKIDALTAVAIPAATDEFAVNQGGVSKKETLSQIVNFQPPIGKYDVGSPVVATDQFLFQYRHLYLTGTERLTLAGTSRLVLSDFATLQVPQPPLPLLGEQAIGSLVVGNRQYAVQYNRLELVQADRLTLQGSGRLILSSDVGPPPSGYKLAHVQDFANVNITATNQAGAIAILTCPPIVFDGMTPVMLELFTPRIATGGGAGSGAFVELYDGSTDLGTWGYLQADSSTPVSSSLFLRLPLTPTSGSHTYSARLWRQVANGSFGGITGLDAPYYLRISRA